jgi:GDP-fucose transporter C1
VSQTLAPGSLHNLLVKFSFNSEKLQQEATMTEKTLLQRYVHILTVVACYWFVSITLVFINKSLLSGSEKLDGPLFVTCYQCIVTVAACYAIWTALRIFPDRISFPILQLDIQVIKQVGEEIYEEKLNQ